MDGISPKNFAAELENAKKWASFVEFVQELRNIIYFHLGSKSEKITVSQLDCPHTPITNMATDAVQYSRSISGSATLLRRNDNKREINNLSPEASAVKTGGTDQKLELKHVGLTTIQSNLLTEEDITSITTERESSFLFSVCDGVNGQYSECSSLF
ncbi:hypothetical protein J6590_069310 [Homalodisca vitripennis]|nr:hypothetical protein J6590_069310 [Homalodisca vitripennis]